MLHPIFIHMHTQKLVHTCSRFTAAEAYKYMHGNVCRRHCGVGCRPSFVHMHKHIAHTAFIQHSAQWCRAHWVPGYGRSTSFVDFAFSFIIRQLRLYICRCTPNRVETMHKFTVQVHTANAANAKLRENKKNSKEFNANGRSAGNMKLLTISTHR